MAVMDPTTAGSRSGQVNLILRGTEPGPRRLFSWAGIEIVVRLIVVLVATVGRSICGAADVSQPSSRTWHTELVRYRLVGQDWEHRTYRGIGPHPADPRTAEVAEQVAAMIADTVPGTVAEHVGSTAVPDMIGKNIVDLQITASPDEVPAITSALLGLGFAWQRDRDPWPPERPMVEGTVHCRDGVFLVHCHVVPATDPDVGQMLQFRDLLRRSPAARRAYAQHKLRLTAGTADPLEYTRAKTGLIRRLLGG